MSATPHLDCRCPGVTAAIGPVYEGVTQDRYNEGQLAVRLRSCTLMGVCVQMLPRGLWPVRRTQGAGSSSVGACAYG